MLMKTRLRTLLVLLVIALCVTLSAAFADYQTKVERLQLPSIAGHSVAGNNRPPSTLLVIGDSFPAGGGVFDSRHAYPTLLAHTVGMDLMVDAQGGTGFIADGQDTGNGDTDTLIDRLPVDGFGDSHPGVIVIDAGRNDLDESVGRITTAVSEYLHEVRRQWPVAEIVFVFPAFVNPTPFDNYQPLRSQLYDLVSDVRGTFVDPFADGWYRDVDTTSLLADDGVHPNAEGNRFIAARLADSLRTYGLVPTT